jgi:exopolysaccharide biosynthesis polyprenyl glycosylphosphotransferase
MKLMEERTYRAVASSPTTPPRRRREQLLLLGFDAVSLAAGVALSRVNGLSTMYGVLAIAILNLCNESRCRLDPDALVEAPRLVGRLMLPILPVALLARSDPQRGAFVASLPATLGLVLAGRFLAYRGIRSGRTRGRLEPTIIVGTGSVGYRAATTLLHNPRYGLRPIGFVSRGADGGVETPLPLLGDIENLARLAAVTGTTRVLVAFDIASERELVPILRACDGLGVKIYVVPRLFELGAQGAGMWSDEIWSLPLVPVGHGGHSARCAGKRIFDVVMSALLLVLTGPMLAATTLALWLSQGRPILFRQTRISQGGQGFELLKFRTLSVNRNSDREWTPGKEGMTRLGKLLRETGLDELPQLFNVLRGEMSLVGPRPERPSFVEKFTSEIPYYADRHRVRSGITGWAQINGLHGDTSIPDRARFDNYYVDNWSPWRDCVILLRTAFSLKPHPDKPLTKEAESSKVEGASEQIVRMPDVSALSVSIVDLVEEAGPAQT